MSRVRLEMTLDELHATIAESVRVALFARKLAIASVVVEAPHPRTSTGPCGCNACSVAGELLRGLSAAELEATFREAGRNAAGALMLFAADDEVAQ